MRQLKSFEALNELFETFWRATNSVADSRVLFILKLHNVFALVVKCFRKILRTLLHNVMLLFQFIFQRKDTIIKSFLFYGNENTQHTDFELKPGLIAIARKRLMEIVILGGYFD